MTSIDINTKKDEEAKLVKAVSREICQYFGFHDETIGESFYLALKRGDFRYLQLKTEQQGGSDVN
ncbi:TPA: hypothetical protein JHJ72_003809 [Escherichia coli]|nr:hypothetical protein [Escherichia coli]